MLSHNAGRQQGVCLPTLLPDEQMPNKDENGKDSVGPTDHSIVEIANMALLRGVKQIGPQCMGHSASGRYACPVPIAIKSESILDSLIWSESVDDSAWRSVVLSASPLSLVQGLSVGWVDDVLAGMTTSLASSKKLCFRCYWAFPPV